MLTKGEMKNKYAEEFDRDKNYQMIMKPKRKQNIRYGISFFFTMCICMVLLSVNHLKKESKISDDSVSQVDSEIVLNVNVFDGSNESYDASPSLRADMDLKRSYAEEVPDFLNELCPDGFASSENTEFVMAEKDSTKEVLSYQSVVYTKGENSIRLSYSKDGWPFRCAYLSPDEKVSVIGEAEMRISHQPASNLYLSLFELNGFYFDVEAIGLSETEFVDFLLNLVNKVVE